MNKYKLVKSKFIEIEDKKLYRIQALKDFNDVKKGDLGGYIESENNLSQIGNAWVSGDALVYGKAEVYGDALVYGKSVVYGNSKVYGNAKVYGQSVVYGNAWVYGNAKVSGDVWVSRNAKVSGNAWVHGNAWVYDNARVYGDAKVSGKAEVYGDAKVSGDVWVYGNAEVYGDALVYGKAEVYGDAKVYGNAWVYGNSSVYGYAEVYGDAKVYVNACDVELYEDPLVNEDKNINMFNEKQREFSKNIRSIKREKETEAIDFVNQPPHYKKHPSGIECIQVTEHFNFCLGNAIKYIWRAEFKNGLEDLQKAEWYIKKEINRREKNEG